MALPFNITPASVLSNVGYVLDALGLGVKIDVVGIYDSQGFRQVFADARPVKAMVRETSKVMDYPVETGVILSDHHIILPTVIEMTMIIPVGQFSSTYQQIRAAFINATQLSVQTRTGVYNNMIVWEMPHQEEAEMFDSIVMGLRLREVQATVPASIAQPNAPANYSPIDPLNQSTVARGVIPRIIQTLPASVLGYIQAINAWGR